MPEDTNVKTNALLVVRSESKSNPVKSKAQLTSVKTQDKTRSQTRRLNRQEAVRQAALRTG